MNISEIFYSIQGEGKYIGTPVIFVRTAGCSLHCPWCDSKSTWRFPEDDGVDAHHILMDVMRASSKCKTIVITGGEPTEQRDLYNIVESFKQEGYSVHLETNGTNNIVRGYFTHVVCSPKPGNKFHVPKGVDELKYVISASESDSNINEMIPGFIRTQYAGRIWLQPMDEGSEEKLQANIQKCLSLTTADPRLRIGIQLHKLYNVR